MQKNSSTENKKQTKKTPKTAQEGCQWKVCLFNFSSVCLYVHRKLYWEGGEKNKVFTELKKY